MLHRASRWLGLGVLAGIFAVSSAQAGVFTLAHYLPPSSFSLGIEPELTLTSGAGLGFNAKYSQGITDLMNGTILLGTGGGPRKFRIGTQLGFDFFPDIEGQPGVGLAASLIYYRLAFDGQIELTAIPYIHKSFLHGSNEIEPFFALPIGMTLTAGNYEAVCTAVVGAMFKSSPNIRYTLELGIAVNHTDTYVSGGVSYSK